MNDIEFASLLCSRLCHDLVSPAGALANGIEIMSTERDPEIRNQCMQLLTDSAEQTINRLKFFRIAFGAGSGFASQIDRADIEEAIKGLFNPAKVKIEWLPSMQFIPKVAAKVALNLALIAGDALLWGGTVKIGIETMGKNLDLAIRAEGSRLSLNDEVHKALTGDIAIEDLSPRSAPAYLVQSLVHSQASKLNLSIVEDQTLTIGISLPMTSKTTEK